MPSRAPPCRCFGLLLCGRERHAEDAACTAHATVEATPGCACLVVAPVSLTPGEPRQARFLAIHAAPSSLVLLINAPKSVQARLELRHRAEVRCSHSIGRLHAAHSRRFSNKKAQLCFVAFATEPFCRKREACADPSRNLPHGDLLILHRSVGVQGYLRPTAAINNEYGGEERTELYNAGLQPGW
jgi:hypothetical protein